jgi:hypothetical protein
MYSVGEPQGMQHIYDDITDCYYPSKAGAMRVLRSYLNTPGESLYVYELETKKGTKKFPIYTTPTQVSALLKKLSKAMSAEDNLPLRFNCPDNSSHSFDLIADRLCPSNTQPQSWKIILEIGDTIGRPKMFQFMKAWGYTYIPRIIDEQAYRNLDNVECMILDPTKFRQVKRYRFVNGIEVDSVTIKDKNKIENNIGLMM